VPLEAAPTICRAMAPGLSPEIALHLVNEDPEHGVFSRAVRMLVCAQPRLVDPALRTRDDIIVGVQRRRNSARSIPTAGDRRLYSDYRLDLGRRFYAAYWRCALTERFEIVRCQHDRTSLGDLPLEEHAAAILQLGRTLPTPSKRLGSIRSLR
jgi:hypothetical protein